MKLTKLTDHLKLATDKLVGFKPEPYELNPVLEKLQRVFTRWLTSSTSCFSTRVV